MKNNYHPRIMKIYERDLTYNKEQLRKRKEEVYKKIPKIDYYERQMAKKSLEIARLRMKESDLNIDVELNKIKEEITKLKSLKADDLTMNGFSPDFMDMKYNCPICKDTGYINLDKCSCYYKKLSDIVYEDSEFSNLLNEYSFDNFKYDVFSNDTVDKNFKLTPYQNMRRQMQIALNFTNTFDRINDNLFLFGSSGTGKTFLATCIARELLKSGKLVIYRTSAQLIDDIKEMKFSENQDLRRLLLDSDLLIIDDLGTEMISSISDSEIFNIINSRLLKKKKMIISSNFYTDDLKNRYSERLVSRLTGEFIFMPFFGEDLRLKKGISRMQNLNSKLG